MSIRLSCSSGHQWEAEDEQKSTCPVCGAAGETVIEDATYSTLPNWVDETPPPQRQCNPAQDDDDPLSTLDEFNQSGASGETRMFGRYEIVKSIGRGGMGTVYLARDTQLDRQVAIKVPRFSKDSSNLLERFQREARAAATLDHPNICSVYDVGQIGGLDYITMAYIEGKTLSRLIKDQHPLPQSAVADVVRKLALAMQEAHDAGIVHRDLKPDNVMVNLRYEPVIMDFGLAQRETPSDVKLTTRGAIMGSPAYMSPEQVAGKTEEIGPSTDIYSLGVVLYQLLTGRLPFEGSLGEVLGQIAKEDPSAPSTHRRNADPTLEQICLRAMAKRPEARFASMGEFADALSGYLEGRETPPLDTSEKPSPGDAIAASPSAVVSGDRAEQLLEKLVAKLQSAPAVAAPQQTASEAWRWITAIAGLLLLGGFGISAMLGRDETDPPLVPPVTNEITFQQVIYDLQISNIINQPDLLVFVDGERVDGEQLESVVNEGTHELVVKRGDDVVAQRSFAVDVRENVSQVVLIKQPSIAIETDSDRTGVQLSAGAYAISPPRYWHVYDASGKKEIATSQGWSFLELEPGEYSIGLTPDGPGDEPIQWRTLKIGDRELATLRIDSGIDLRAGSTDQPPPRYWYIYKAGAEDYLTYVDNEWGFTPLPPGRYEIRIRSGKRGYEAVSWGEVDVAAGEVKEVTVDSGVKLVGRNENDPAPKYWYIYKPGASDYLTYADGTWGFTPLPPGRYEIRIESGKRGYQAVSWGEVDVAAGEVKEVTVDSGVKLVGRDENDPAPKYWYIYKPGATDYLTYADGTWGFTPLPPGRYEIRIESGKQGYAAVSWGEVDVAAGEVKEVTVDSGVELVSRNATDPAPRYWYIYKPGANKYLTYVDGVWGFTPLPSGDYVVTLEPRGNDAMEIPWQEISLAQGQVETIRINSGIVLSGHVRRDRAFDAWYVHARGGDKPLAWVSGRWGFASLPPGAYDLYIQPGRRGSQPVRWQANVKVEENRVTEIAVKSGIELVAPAPFHSPPKSWKVFHSASRQPITEVSEGWCWTPLRPGEYYVQLDYGDQQSRSRNISVVEGKVEEVTLAEMGIAVEELPEDQRTGIALWGASRDEVPPPSWSMYDNATKKIVTRVAKRWGFTQLKPGSYRVTLMPRDANAIEQNWGEISVKPGQVSIVTVDSGVELIADSEDVVPPISWTVHDAGVGVEVAQVGRRWGFLSLPSGEYYVAASHLSGHGESEPFKIEAGQIKRLTLKDLGLSTREDGH